jgi:hypothetical protein
VELILPVPLMDLIGWRAVSREWNVEGKHAEKVTQWKEEDQAEREEEERRRMGRRWTEFPMPVDVETRKMVIFRRRVRMMRMIQNLEGKPLFFLEELSSSFVSVSGSSKIFKESYTIG